MKQAHPVALFVTLVLCAACGGAGFQAGTTWQPGEARFFDDGIDLFGDLSKLSGKWKFQIENDLDGRVQLADLVAEVEIISVQSSRDNEKGEAKTLQLRVAHIIYGTSPQNSIALTSWAKAPGHQLMVRYEQHLSGKYLAFVRWFKDENGSVSHHFHLSPATEQLKSEVTKRLSARLKEEEAQALGKVQ